MTAIYRKRCTKCLMSKQPEEFKGGNHKNWCEPCYKKYFVEYNKKRDRSTERQRSREKYENLVRPRRFERKNAMIYLMGGKCSVCGYCKNAAALEFDHLHEGKSFSAHGTKNPDKSRALSHLLAQNTPEGFAAAIEESKKCRLLCSNCHREHTYPDQILLPQTKTLEEIIESEANAFRTNSKRSDTQKKKLSDSLKESWIASGREHPRQFAIERVDPKTGEIKEYRSSREAEKDGFNNSCISQAVNNKLQSHKGYWWRKANNPSSTN